MRTMQYLNQCTSFHHKIAVQALQDVEDTDDHNDEDEIAKAKDPTIASYNTVTNISNSIAPITYLQAWNVHNNRRCICPICASQISQSARPMRPKVLPTMSIHGLYIKFKSTTRPSSPSTTAQAIAKILTPKEPSTARRVSKSPIDSPWPTTQIAQDNINPDPKSIGQNANLAHKLIAQRIPIQSH